MIFSTCYVNHNAILLEPGTADNSVTSTIALGEGIYIPKTDWRNFGLWEKIAEIYGSVSNIPNYWEMRKKKEN